MVMTEGLEALGRDGSLCSQLSNSGAASFTNLSTGVASNKVGVRRTSKILVESVSFHFVLFLLVSFLRKAMTFHINLEVAYGPCRIRRCWSTLSHEVGKFHHYAPKVVEPKIWRLQPAGERARTDNRPR